MASFLTGRRSVLVFLGILIVAVIVAVVVAQAMSVSNSVIQVNNAAVTYAGTNEADAVFKDKGTYFVRADCGNVNSTGQCCLVVSLSLSSDHLYTKSITLKLTNNRFSTMAVGVSTFSNPPTQFQIGYGFEYPSTILVTINTLVIGPGSTWTFDIILSSPPIVNGKVVLDLTLGARIVENQLFGRTNDLTANVQLPSTG